MQLPYLLTFRAHFCSVFFCFWVSLQRLFSLIIFNVQTMGEKKSLFLVLIVAAVFQGWQTQSIWKLLLPTGCAAGKSEEPWTSYHRCNKQISVLGSEGSIPEDPRARKLSTNLSQWKPWFGASGHFSRAHRDLSVLNSPDAGNHLLMWKRFLKSLVRFMCLLLYSLKVLGSKQDRL